MSTHPLEHLALTLGYLAATVGVVFHEIHGAAYWLASVAIWVYVAWMLVRSARWLKARRARRRQAA